MSIRHGLGWCCGTTGNRRVIYYALRPGRHCLNYFTHPDIIGGNIWWRRWLQQRVYAATQSLGIVYDVTEHFNRWTGVQTFINNGNSNEPPGPITFPPDALTHYDWTDGDSSVIVDNTVERDTIGLADDLRSIYQDSRVAIGSLAGSPSGQYSEYVLAKGEQGELRNDIVDLGITGGDEHARDFVCAIYRDNAQTFGVSRTNSLQYFSGMFIIESMLDLPLDIYTRETYDWNGRLIQTQAGTVPESGMTTFSIFIDWQVGMGSRAIRLLDSRGRNVLQTLTPIAADAAL